MSTPETTPSIGSASALHQTLADIVQAIDVPVSMGAGKVLLKVREHQGALHLGPAHLVNARGEVRAVEVVSFSHIEVTSAEVIERGVHVIRVRGATADDASHYQWLVQE
jgi:hypothetical protein